MRFLVEIGESYSLIRMHPVLGIPMKIANLGRVYNRRSRTYVRETPISALLLFQLQ